MPNKYQLAFIFSCVLSTASLILSLRAINHALLAAGFDFTDLILIGLPKDKDHPEMGNYELNEIIGNVDLKALASSPAVLISAIAVIATIFFAAFYSSSPRKVLNPKEWQEFPLVQKTQVSPNTAIYRFALPRNSDILGLPIGQHISVAADINGKEIMRSYTPISSDDDLGYFDLLIKSYPQGNISKHFTTLKLGDKLKVKGPKGQFTYTPDLADHIGMLAGGSGITPMLQIIRAALKDPNDKTKLTLIYANVNPDDILLKEDIEKLVDTSNKRLKVYYVLNNPPAVWNGGVGFVTKEHIDEHLPKSHENGKILLCGPPPMMNAMKKHLADLRFPAPRTVSKLGDQVFLF